MTSSVIPEGSVVITPFQMYQEQQETTKTLGAVSNKIDSVVAKLDHYQEDQAARLDKIDGKDGAIAELRSRVGSLERWRWKAAGVAAVIAAPSAAVATALITRSMAGH